MSLKSITKTLSTSENSTLAQLVMNTAAYNILEKLCMPEDLKDFEKVNLKVTGAFFVFEQPQKDGKGTADGKITFNEEDDSDGKEIFTVSLTK